MNRPDLLFFDKEQRSFLFSARAQVASLALAVFFAAPCACCGWTVAQPYSDAAPLVVEPGAAGHFCLTLLETDPLAGPSMLFGYILPDCPWFILGGETPGAPTVFVSLSPKVPEQVQVLYAIPDPTPPGVYEFAYLFTDLEDSSVYLNGGFPVVVEGAAENLPPVAMAECGGTFEMGIDPVALVGYVGDPDGDELSYAWLLDGALVADGITATSAGGEPVALPAVPLDLGLGLYHLALVVTDGSSDPVEDACTFEVVDTMPPSMAPVADPQALRPSKKWQRVVVSVNPTDNSNLSVALEAGVSFSGFVPRLKGPRVAPECCIEAIDQAAGLVYVMVKPYGKRKSGFPVFQVDLTAVDQAGNRSATTVEIAVTRRR
jgi:hypothetical protein